MKFLEKYDFSREEINDFNLGCSPKIIGEIIKYSRLVVENLKYLSALGINNFKEIFVNYPDMFLIDHSNFINIFEKYDKNELIEKLNANYKMAEYL